MHKYLQVDGNVVSVDIDRIAPSPFQARTVFDDREIDSLARSIYENGLLQPVTIRRVSKGQFELIAGERRLRASKLAGHTKIRAVVCEVDDNVSAIFGYLENVQRSDLNPFEQARGIQKLMAIWEVTQEEAAERLLMSQPSLCNKLRILALTKEQEGLCVLYNLTERHARAVLSIADEQSRTRLLQKAGTEGLNVSKLEALIRLEKTKTIPKPKKKIIVRDVRIFANTINKAISYMQQSGISATADRKDTDEYIEYIVRIPIVQAVQAKVPTMVG